MDSRLQRVGGTRLAHLRRMDAPKVAQALVDAIEGRARILSGISHDVAYVEFIRDKSYSVVIRGDDWRKIFPFFRYSTTSYSPVIPPETAPSPILSPQPNRVMPPPPENPAGGLRSFLDGIPYQEYVQIQKLLTTFAVDDFDSPAFSSKPSRPAQEPSSLNPPEQQTDGPLENRVLYNRLVSLLQQLFPTDFPTHL